MVGLLHLALFISASLGWIQVDAYVQLLIRMNNVFKWDLLCYGGNTPIMLAFVEY